MDVDPDINRALTPPRELYFDPRHFAAQRERVFARSWIPIGAAADVAAPGAAKAVTLLPGCLDEPLVLVNESGTVGGALRLLSNVCTHRGHLVVAPGSDAKNLRSLRCRYHGRSFALDGRCLAAPGFESAPDFPRREDSLTSASLGEWRGLLFGALAPAAPLATTLAAVDARIGALAVTDWRAAPELDRTFEFDANWALYVENYLEGLHIPFIHPGLDAKLDWKSYRYESFANGTLQIGIAAPGELAFELPAGHPDTKATSSGDDRTRVAAFYFWLFPNLMLNVYPWGLSLNVVEPLSPTRTRVRFHVWLHDRANHGRGAGSGLDQVELEDERACASVQQGMAARLFPRGRYAPVAESGTHHFHRLLAAALAT
jgi:phenylpropionate dioxygenase-like ring-hydroxylating dioxygenase large terminal subunit